MEKYIKCPLNYVGGKTKLLPQILPLFPTNIDTFIDLFCGGANVAVNVKANKIVAIDINLPIIELYRTFQNLSIETILSYIQDRINEYKLDKTNKEGYLTFRKNYNANKNPLDLFILICYSFNNQIRFNSKGDFNMPFGKDRSSFNNRIKENLINFHSAIKDIKFASERFRDFNIDELKENDFVYVDPPYLITCASYNERNGWNEKDENDLCELLDRLNAKGIKFALSNVLTHKGQKNEILNNWLNNNHYNVHHLNVNYSNCNYQVKDKVSKSDEVLITNY